MRHEGFKQSGEGSKRCARRFKQRRARVQTMRASIETIRVAFQMEGFSGADWQGTIRKSRSRGGMPKADSRRLHPIHAGRQKAAGLPTARGTPGGASGARPAAWCSMIQSRCGVIHPEVARRCASIRRSTRHRWSDRICGPSSSCAAGSPRMRWRLAVGRGVRQYVVLGAGFDTFAYRNPFPELRVFRGRPSRHAGDKTAAARRCRHRRPGVG